MKKVFVLLLATFFCFLLHAQDYFQPEAPEQDSLPEIINKLYLEQDSRLNNMVRWHIDNNRKKNGVDGWRVEIFFSRGSDAMENAKRVKQEFLSMYPDIPVHIKFIAPQFKVRVGDFRTRNEALKLRKELIRKYPKSFEVKDIIKFPNLSTGEISEKLNE